MKLVLCFLTALLTWTPASAQPEETAPAFVDAYAALGQPGPQHQELVALQGSWLVAGRMRFGPEDDWEELFATVEIEPWFGGRFLAQRIHGEQTESWPVRYEGLRVLGYDNMAGEFVYVIFNNLQTGIMAMRGERTGATLALQGPFLNPLTGKPQRWRTEYRYLSSDRFVMLEYPRTADDREYVGIEAVYTRVRSDNPLPGVWKGVHVGGETMTFTFDPAGKALWRIQDGDIEATFDLRYRVDLSTTPHHLELYGFKEGPLAGKTMFGILDFDEAGRFRLDLEPGEAGSTGESVRPLHFSPDTLTCRRLEDRAR